MLELEVFAEEVARVNSRGIDSEVRPFFLDCLMAIYANEEPETVPTPDVLEDWQIRGAIRKAREVARQNPYSAKQLQIPREDPSFPDYVAELVRTHGSELSEAERKYFRLCLSLKAMGLARSDLLIPSVEMGSSRAWEIQEMAEKVIRDNPR